MGPQGQRVAAGVRRRRDHQKLRKPHRARVSGSPCRKPGFPPSSLVRDVTSATVWAMMKFTSARPPAPLTHPLATPPRHGSRRPGLRTWPTCGEAPRIRQALAGAPLRRAPRGPRPPKACSSGRLCRSLFPAAQRPGLRPSRSWPSRLPSESPVLPRLGASPICLPRVAE